MKAKAEQAIEAIREILDEIADLPRHEKRGPFADHRLACDEDEEELDPAKIQQLTRRAQEGDRVADATLQMLVELDVNSGATINKSLHEYILERLRTGSPAAPRGHPKEENFARDWLLHVAVESLRQCGFSPTRNRALKTESASSLVKEALSDRGLIDWCLASDDGDKRGVSDSPNHASGKTRLVLRGLDWRGELAPRQGSGERVSAH